MVGTPLVWSEQLHSQSSKPSRIPPIRTIRFFWSLKAHSLTNVLTPTSAVHVKHLAVPETHGMAASSGGYAAFDRESYRAEIVSIRQESTHVKYCIETCIASSETHQLFRVFEGRRPRSARARSFGAPTVRSFSFGALCCRVELQLNG